MAEGEHTPGGGPWWRLGESWPAVCLEGSRTSWHRGRQCPEACPWEPGEAGMAQMLCLCMVARMRRAARLCHNQCSPFISYAL